MVICASMIETKTSQQRAENSCVPLRTPPACSKVLSLAKGWRAKRKEKNAESAKREKNNREKSGAFYFEFLRPLNKFALSRGGEGTVNRQKIYWSSPRRLSVTFIAPQYFPPEIQLVRPLLPSCSFFFVNRRRRYICASARLPSVPCGGPFLFFFSFFF